MQHTRQLTGWHPFGGQTPLVGKPLMHGTFDARASFVDVAQLAAPRQLTAVWLPCGGQTFDARKKKSDAQKLEHLLVGWQVTCPCLMSFAGVDDWLLATVRFWHCVVRCTSSEERSAGGNVQGSELGGHNRGCYLPSKEP